MSEPLMCGGNGGANNQGGGGLPGHGTGFQVI